MSDNRSKNESNSEKLRIGAVFLAAKNTGSAKYLQKEREKDVKETGNPREDDERSRGE